MADIVEDLDRDRSVADGIVRVPHDTHAAPARAAGGAVLSEQRADGKVHAGCGQRAARQLWGSPPAQVIAINAVAAGLEQLHNHFLQAVEIGHNS